MTSPPRPPIRPADPRVPFRRATPREELRGLAWALVVMAVLLALCALWAEPGYRRDDLPRVRLALARRGFPDAEVRRSLLADCRRGGVSYRWRASHAYGSACSARTVDIEIDHRM